MDNGSRILTAFLAGAAVGALLGLLYAPAPGSETRQNLSEGAKRISDKVKAKAEAGMSYVSSLKDKANDTINDLLRTQDESETV